MVDLDSDVKEAILEHINALEARIVHTLQQLIRYPTVNPPGNEREHQEFVAAQLQALGLKTQLFEAEPGRPNLIAILPGVGNGPKLLHYAGHADVVPAGDPMEWRYPRFGGEIHDGWVWGRGAVDHKGPIAASLAAIEAIVTSGLRLSGDIIFLVPVDEELGSKAGTRYLLKKSLLYGDIGLYASAGFPQDILIACSGTLNFEITVYGRESHGGYPDVGINAIELASRLVLALQNMIFDKINPFWSPEQTDLLAPTRTGSMTVSSIIGGGAVFEVVPDKCLIRGSRRLIPTETPGEAHAQIEDLLTSLAGDDPNFKAELKIVDAVSGINTPPDSPIVRIVQTAVRDLGLEPVLGGSSGGFDARWIVDGLGLPMVSYGAGWNDPDGKLCIHAPNESISIENLVSMAKAFALIMLRACEVA